MTTTKKPQNQQKTPNKKQQNTAFFSGLVVYNGWIDLQFFTVGNKCELMELFTVAFHSAAQSWFYRDESSSICQCG